MDRTEAEKEAYIKPEASQRCCNIKPVIASQSLDIIIPLYSRVISNRVSSRLRRVFLSFLESRAKRETSRHFLRLKDTRKKKKILMKF